ncbi:hypothetical protein [Allosphingosinicella sp.]|uniref:hypothetical protein n=1 Tax=Allosphingosinicella sp. TaxID=2823234 RepID=UPI002F0A1543
MAERPARIARRWLEGAFVAAVAAGLAWAGWGFWHDRRFPARFTQVQLGMDRKGVEALLGAPGWEGACAGSVRYLPRAQCTRELGYSSAFAPLRPVHYIVQLDRSGKVIEAEPVRSR